MKSGNLNFLNPSGPLQACNGIAACFFTGLVYAFTQRDNIFSDLCKCFATVKTLSFWNVINLMNLKYSTDLIWFPNSVFTKNAVVTRCLWGFCLHIWSTMWWLCLVHEMRNNSVYVGSSSASICKTCVYGFLWNIMWHVGHISGPCSRFHVVHK